VVVEPAKESIMRSLPDHSPEQPDQHVGTLSEGTDRCVGRLELRQTYRAWQLGKGPRGADENG
jgi:hypothetical protein